jgi:hypothetical protein
MAVFFWVSRSHWNLGLRGWYDSNALSAEGVGFEPTGPCGRPHFKCGGINHYPTPPILFYAFVDLERIELSPNRCHRFILPLNYRPSDNNSPMIFSSL